MYRAARECESPWPLIRKSGWQICYPAEAFLAKLSGC
jgi:hypothetical protein